MLQMRDMFINTPCFKIYVLFVGFCPRDIISEYYWCGYSPLSFVLGGLYPNNIGADILH